MKILSVGLWMLLVTSDAVCEKLIKALEGDNVTLSFNTNSVNPVRITNADRTTVINYHSSINTCTIPSVFFPERYGASSCNSTHISFTITDVKLEDAGNFTCSGLNEYITGCWQYLVILSKPTKPVIEQQGTPIIGQSLTLTCSSKSTSKPLEYMSDKLMFYKWFRNNLVFPPTSKDVSISVSTESILYTCNAQNEGGPSSVNSDAFSLTAAPKIVSMKPDSNPYRVLEGSTIILECEVEKSSIPPITTFSWTINGSITGHTTSKYTISSISKQTGIYGCSATNRIGNSNNITKTITVLSGPTIVAETTEVTTSGAGNADLKCISSQDVVVTWIKLQSTVIVHTGINYRIKVSENTVYMCIATSILIPSSGNPVTRTATATINVFYKHHPRLPMLNTQKIEAKARLGHSFVMTFEYEAYPEITEFYLMSTTLSITTLQNVTLSHNTFKLSSEKLEESDFITYTLTARNTEGALERTFALQGFPVAPGNLVAKGIDSETVDLKWTPSFDGGAEQMFSVKFTRDGVEWKTFHSDHISNSDTGEVEARVSGISSGVFYIFKVVAYNKFGLKSVDSNLSPFMITKESNNTGIIIHSVLTVLIVFVIIATSVYWYRKNKHINLESKKNDDGKAPPIHNCNNVSCLWCSWCKCCTKKPPTANSVEKSNYDTTCNNHSEEVMNYEELRKKTNHYVNATYNASKENIYGEQSERIYENINGINKTKPHNKKMNGKRGKY